MCKLLQFRVFVSKRGLKIKVSVVGAGFCGLALSWYLLEKGFSVTLYEKKEIGAGASGIASGLLHPYPGEGLKRSLKTDEALKEAKALLSVAQEFSEEVIADFSGLIRQVTPEQFEILTKHRLTYGDVEPISDTFFLIKSGIAIYSNRYLEGLYKACLSKGLTFCIRQISSFEDLEGYDLSFLALGGGVFTFPKIPLKRLSPVKGQALVCQWPSHFPVLERVLLAKGHIVPLKEGSVYLGSTYERGVLEEDTCLESTLLALSPLARELVPNWEKIVPERVYAGIRVACLGHYFPVFHKIEENVWVLTGMGSRGLLYHAYMAKQVIEAALLDLSKK